MLAEAAVRSSQTRRRSRRRGAALADGNATRRQTEKSTKVKFLQSNLICNKANKKMKDMSKETRKYLKNGTSNLNATIEYKFTFSLTPDVRREKTPLR